MTALFANLDSPHAIVSPRSPFSCFSWSLFTHLLAFNQHQSAKSLILPAIKLQPLAGTLTAYSSSNKHQSAVSPCPALFKTACWCGGTSNWPSLTRSPWTSGKPTRKTNRKDHALARRSPDTLGLLLSFRHAGFWLGVASPQSHFSYAPIGTFGQPLTTGPPLLHLHYLRLQSGSLEEGRLGR